MQRSTSALAVAVFLGFAAGCNRSGGGGSSGSSSTAAPVASTTSSGSHVQPVAGSSRKPSPSPTPATPTTTARLAVDTDRDGKITAADDAGRDQWTNARGAVFAFNNDDEDGKHAIDASDNVVNGSNDPRSMGHIVARQLSGTAPTAATLSVAPAGAPVRVFRADAHGNWVELLPPGTSSEPVPVADLMAGDVSFLIEATAPRSASWDGNVTVRLDLAGPASGQASHDVVALRCAPLIYTDNTRPAQVVYSMRIDDPSQGPNAAFWNTLQSGLASQNVQLYEVNQSTYGFDRWVQDGMQIGYQGFVGPNGYDWIDDYNQLERGNGAGGGQPGGDLWSLVPDELLSANHGMTYAGVSHVQDSPNYGGNLEVLPPYDPSFPFGRIMRGGGDAGTVDGSSDSRHMNPEEVALLEAQGMQSPTIEISSEWLAVGHLDEFLMAVPDLSGKGAHPFKILWASPTLAIKALQQLKAAGRGTAKVFAGQSMEKTVDQVLSDTNLMTYNDECQARLDSDRAALEQATGLTDADFIEVPVYYEISAYNGLNYAIAQMPGVQNCIPVNDTLYMPDPAGPADASGHDVWKQQILSALTPIGLKVVFVDVFQSYHQLMGEAHCGSNVLYEPYDAPWWTK